MDSTPRIPVLNSWKEIAAYLNRGVRTVQRWECDLHMPVHRPKGKDRSAVIAFPEELDSWLHAAPMRFGQSVNSLAAVTKSLDTVAKSKVLGANANGLLLRVTEIAREQSQRARSIREQVQALRDKCVQRRNQNGEPKDGSKKLGVTARG